jgi:hypothetical protein
MKRHSNNRNNNRFKNLATTLGSMLIVLALAFTFLSIANIKVAAANSTSSNVVANVAVQSYCELGGTPQTIAFGTVIGGGTYDTNALITANTVGNTNGNILVFGTLWTYISNSFAVSYTLWNPTALASYTGNALTGSPVNTFIAVAPIAGSMATNNIYFGVQVPSGQAPDTYTQTITLQDSCSGAANSFTVSATLTVPGQCYISVSPSSINFGNINPGSNTPFISNEIGDTNTGGNVNANILVEGSQWQNGATTFAVSNTQWNPSNVAYGRSLVNTNIQIPYPPTSQTGNIFFGVAVPPGEPAGTYTQNVLLENLC